MSPAPSRLARRRTTLRVSLGISLIAGSLLASFAVMESRGETQSVVIATGALVAGDTVSSGDFSRVELPTSPLWDGYLSESEGANLEGLVASKSIGPNELLVPGDFQEPSTLDDTVITVALSIGSPSWLQRGARVEIWVAPPASENSFSAPFILSPEAVVDSIAVDEGFAADGASSRVDLRIPLRDASDAIHALANGYFLHLTPLGRSR